MKSEEKAFLGSTHLFNCLKRLTYASTESGPCLISKSCFCQIAFCLGVWKRVLKRCLKLLAAWALSSKASGDKGKL